MNIAQSPLGILLLLPALAAGAVAQKSDAQVQSDITFARGLAEQWSFVDLADGVLRRIEAEGVSSRRAEELALVKCEIYRTAALNEGDRIRRNELFEQALSAYEAYLAEHALSEHAWEAEIGYVQTASMYARSIELSLEEVVGAQAQALQERRQEVLTDAVAKAAELISKLKGELEPTETQIRQKHELMLTRARMLFDIARTQEEGTFYFEQAAQVCEELVFDAGEGTPKALQAYDLLGRIYAAQDRWREAADFFQAVIEQTIPTDPDLWRQILDSGISQTTKEQFWLFVELSTGPLAEALANAGEIEEACRYALHLYNTQKREGFQYSRQLGYPALLDIARVLLRSGGWIGGSLNSGEAKWYPDEESAAADGHNRRSRISCEDFALRIAQQVNNENKGNILQVKAQKLIAEITDRPGARVAPEILFEAAQGVYYEKDYPAAIRGLLRVMAAVETADQATRIEFGPKTAWFLGRTYQKLDRHLEAAVAFREGCTTWSGDPEYDSNNAAGFYASMKEVQRSTGGADPVITRLLDEAGQLAAELGTSDANTIRYAQAEKARRKKAYDEAIALYRQVEPGSDVYEKALVGIAECTFRKQQVTEAETLFNDYLENYVTDPKNAVGNSPRKQARRREAMAKAEFYRALITYTEAEKSGDDEALWRKVIEYIEDYWRRYPEQDVLAPWTMRMVVNAKLALDDVAAARRIYEEMTRLFPDSRFTAAAAIDFYKKLGERKQAAETAGDIEQAMKLEREMAELLELGNKLAPKPSYSNLRAESSHWMALGEFEKAVAILRRLASEEFADEAPGEQLKKYVLPDLGHALLELHRTAEALQILQPLGRDTSDLPSKGVVIDYCRAISGWTEVEENTIEIVPGAGSTAEEFQEVVDLLDKISGSVEKWRCEWYGYKYQLAYAYYVWASGEGGPKDSKKKESAKRQLDVLVQEFGPGFQGVEDACEKAEEPYRSLHGQGRLKRQLVWLWEKVR